MLNNSKLTKYSKTISEILKPSPLNGLKVVDLFAGCGGLSLGFEAVGFETLGYEMCNHASKSYENNLNGSCINQEINEETNYSAADILIAGPPCQPYSVAGKQEGKKDGRNGFPVFLKAIQDLQPYVCIFENVRGLVYKNKNYFNKIIGSIKKAGYSVNYKVLNANEYGIPQNRQRIFVIGLRDTSKEFQFPEKLTKTVAVQNAIGRIRTKFPKDSVLLNSNMDRYILKYEIASNCVNPRDLHFEKPSRTLTCRNLSGNTGDMIRIKLKDGQRRTLSVREAATLQSFPSWFKFTGSKTNKLKQVGNAVPPLLSYFIANSIRQQAFGLPLINKHIDSELV